MQVATISNVPEKIDKPWLFKPGQIPNPLGRPKGSRNKLGELFVQALQSDFQEHGVDVIAKVREEDPSTYLKVIAQIVPKELILKPKAMDDLTEDEILDLVATAVELKSVSGTEGTDQSIASGSDGEVSPQRVIEAPRKEKARRKPK